MGIQEHLFSACCVPVSGLSTWGTEMSKMQPLSFFGSNGENRRVKMMLYPMKSLSPHLPAPNPSGLDLPNEKEGLARGLRFFLKQHLFEVRSSSPRGEHSPCPVPSRLPMARAQGGGQRSHPSPFQGTLGNGSVPWSPSLVTHRSCLGCSVTVQTSGPSTEVLMCGFGTGPRSRVWNDLSR